MRDVWKGGNCCKKELKGTINHWLHWHKRERGGAQPLEEGHGPRPVSNRNWLEPNGSKMADKWTSTRPWASAYVYALPNTSAAKGHTNRHRDSSKAVPPPKSGQWPNSKKSPPPSPKQLLQSSHSLAYGITQPIKEPHHISRHFSPSVMAYTLSVECFSLNPLLTYHFVFHGILSVMRHQEPELHYMRKPDVWS